VELSLLAQNQPNCSGIGRDVDVRCACVKDPSSKLCEMVKAGFYDNSKPKTLKFDLGSALGGTRIPATGAVPRTPARRGAQVTQSRRVEQARVVPLPHPDFLRFLHPNAQFAAGFNFEKLFRSPELLASLFGQSESQDARSAVMAALREMDRLWLSFAPPNDIVILATGRFEHGAAAGMFYAQGIRPVFLGGAGVMMIGPEPAIQSALGRLARPAANADWVAQRGRELSRDHETWIVAEPPAAAGTSAREAAVQSIRRFALGFRLAGTVSLDGEAGADSEADAILITGWIDRMKAMVRKKTGGGAIDALSVERDGSTVRFRAESDALLNAEAGKSAMNSDLGVELYSLIMSGFPGTPTNTVASDKLLAVREGMKREEILSLLGQPLSVSAIHGLETPRETWTYQVPFGKQVTVRLDGGVVTIPPR
jgi:hypothetical protein